MSKYLGSGVLVLLAVACGGTTDIDDPSGGGSSAGGAGVGGKSNGGSAGKATAGSVGMGGSIGTSGAGGSVVTAGSGGLGGGKSVDPRCPTRIPMGACKDAMLSCEYEQFTGCLCYSEPGNFSGFCDKVDPYCPNGGGTGGAPPAAPEAAGIGGITVKIALPPQQICACVNGNWSCSFGY
jgi:hypothetical protein